MKKSGLVAAGLVLATVSVAGDRGREEVIEATSGYTYLNEVFGTDGDQVYWTEGKNLQLQIWTHPLAGPAVAPRMLADLGSLETTGGLFGYVQNEILVDSNALYLAVTTREGYNHMGGAIVKVNKKDGSATFLAKTGYETTSDVYSVQVHSIAQTRDSVLWSEAPYGPPASGQAANRILQVSKAGGTPVELYRRPVTSATSNPELREIFVSDGNLYFQEIDVWGVEKHYSGQISVIPLSGGQPRVVLQDTSMGDTLRDVGTETVKSQFVVKDGVIYWTSMKGVQRTDVATRKTDLAFEQPHHVRTWQLQLNPAGLGIVSEHVKTTLWWETNEDDEGQYQILPWGALDEPQTIITLPAILPNALDTGSALWLSTNQGIERVTY